MAGNPTTKISTAAVLTIVPIILLFALVQNQLVEGLTAGALREE